MEYIFARFNFLHNLLSKKKTMKLFYLNTFSLWGVQWFDDFGKGIKKIDFIDD